MEFLVLSRPVVYEGHTLHNVGDLLTIEDITWILGFFNFPAIYVFGKVFKEVIISLAKPVGFQKVN